MKTHPFTAQQLFRLKPITLERRIQAFYDESGDGTTVIKLVRLLQIRDRIGTEDLGMPCLTLVRTLYIAHPTRTMKRYVYYFQAYFSAEEWAYLVQSFFAELPYFLLWKKIQTVKAVCQLMPYAFTVP
ncbi:MAG: hypothetical protein ACTJHK_07535 [Enterococcus viikkiensis]|uniref:hypothetical protein n=1 Tax=Enterococcus viikkiensis TaxID=930854 RepID=UPI0010F49746|nr:hypothetical protein [Enterococcus viikkiensis]